MAHMHYKGTGKVHSFRGLLADGKQRKIRIQGSVGTIAWRITKFNLFPYQPGTTNHVEHIVQIWREQQATPSLTAVTVDFAGDELLAAAYLSDDVNIGSEPTSLIVTFDNALFVRNIYITHTEVNGSQPANYYIELEEVKVSAAGMAQLAVAATRRTID